MIVNSFRRTISVTLLLDWRRFITESLIQSSFTSRNRLKVGFSIEVIRSLPKCSFSGIGVCQQKPIKWSKSQKLKICSIDLNLIRDGILKWKPIICFNVAARFGFLQLYFSKSRVTGCWFSWLVHIKSENLWNKKYKLSWCCVPECLHSLLLNPSIYFDRELLSQTKELFAKKMMHPISSGSKHFSMAL